MRLPVDKLGTTAKELDLGTAKVYHLPSWNNLTHPQRLAVIRQIATMRGRDPRIAKLTISILRQAGVGPRQYAHQAAALLRWVQDPKNVFYTNEPGERLQDPLYTLKIRHGDCDDMALVLTALFESIRLPWKLVLSGRHQTTGKIRYIEGDKVPSGVSWSHIYCMVGTPPFHPNKWYFAEPTVQGVPLGWDVIEGDSHFLPEMEKGGGPVRVMTSGPTPPGYIPAALPPKANRSPAYEVMGLGSTSALGPMIGAEVASSMMQDGAINWKHVGTSVLTGVSVGIATSLALDWLRGDKIWAGQGVIPNLLGVK